LVWKLFQVWIFNHCLQATFNAPIEACTLWLRIILLCASKHGIVKNFPTKRVSKNLMTQVLSTYHVRILVGMNDLHCFHLQRVIIQILQGSTAVAAEEIQASPNRAKPYNANMLVTATN
jgi:hypothetical protein